MNTKPGGKRVRGRSGDELINVVFALFFLIPATIVIWVVSAPLLPNVVVVLKPIFLILFLLVTFFPPVWFLGLRFFIKDQNFDNRVGQILAVLSLIFFIPTVYSAISQLLLVSVNSFIMVTLILFFLAIVVPVSWKLLCRFYLSYDAQEKLADSYLWILFNLISITCVCIVSVIGILIKESSLQIVIQFFPNLVAGAIIFVAFPILFLAIALPLFRVFGIRFLLSESGPKRLIGWIIAVPTFGIAPLLAIRLYNTDPATGEAVLWIATLIGVGIILWGMSQILGSFFSTRIGRFLGWIFFGLLLMLPLFWINSGQANPKDVNMIYIGLFGIFIVVMFCIGLKALSQAIFKSKAAQLASILSRIVWAVLKGAALFFGALYLGIYLGITTAPGFVLYMVCSPLIWLIIKFMRMEEKHQSYYFSRKKYG